MLRNTEVKNRVSSQASLNNDFLKKDQKCTFCKHIPVFGKAILKSGAGLFHNKGLCTHSCLKKKNKRKRKLLSCCLTSSTYSLFSASTGRKKNKTFFSLFYLPVEMSLPLPPQHAEARLKPFLVFLK